MIFKPSIWLAYLRNGFSLGDYVARKSGAALLAPLAIALLPLSWYLIRAGIHIWPIYTGRLGHQCLESDCAIRWSTRQCAKRIVLVSRGKGSANQHFFDFLPAGTTHHEGSLIYTLAIALTYFKHYRKAKLFCRVPTAKQSHFTIVSDTPIAFKLDNNNKRAADQLVMRLVNESMIPTEYRTFKAYCVVNFRHPYKKIPEDRLQAQRYSSAIYLRSALKFLRDSGIIPVLTGAPPTEELSNLPDDLFVNYADSKWKSDFNDVLLSGNASFCLGSTSGLTLLSSVFGVPCIIHNQVPFKDYWYSPKDILIPKMMRDKSSGKLIRFSEEVVKAALESHYIVDSTTTPYSYEECSEEDILAATEEMCALLKLIPRKSNQQSEASHLGSISRSFLKKYEDYLPSTS